MAFLVGSVPFAFIGGAVQLPGRLYLTILGVILVFTAVHLACFTKDDRPEVEAKNAPMLAAMLSGAVIGLLSGLTGTGGGIFLSPLLMFMGWATTRQAAGISAAFILKNSSAALAGHLTRVRFLPPAVFGWPSRRSSAGSSAQCTVAEDLRRGHCNGCSHWFCSRQVSS